MGKGLFIFLTVIMFLWLSALAILLNAPAPNDKKGEK